MKKEILLQYASTTNWIEEQADELFIIAKQEYPEQFGNFIKEHSYLKDFEIEKEDIYLRFGENVGDWNDTFSFSIPISTFLDLDKFRKAQQLAKKKYLENIEKKAIEAQKEREAKEKRELERLKSKYENKTD